MAHAFGHRFGVEMPLCIAKKAKALDMKIQTPAVAGHPCALG